MEQQTQSTRYYKALAPGSQNAKKIHLFLAAILLALGGMLAPAKGFAAIQTTNISMPADGQSNTISVCNAITVYDPGGTGNYANNHECILIILPGAEGTDSKVTLTFSSFVIENGWDNVYIYNGKTTAAPLLAILTGTEGVGRSFTASGVTGALTIYFDSDGSNVASGFVATVSSSTADTLIATGPVSTSLCNGASSVISVLSGGQIVNPPTYQWYSNVTNSIVGGTSLGAAATANTYSPPTVVDGTFYYYCVVSGACVSRDTSDIATITVTPLPVTTGWISPSATAVNQGAASVVSLQAAGLGNGTYTVTYNLSGGTVATGLTATAIMNAGEGSFTTAAITGALNSTVHITGIANALGCTHPVSANNTATINVNPAPVTWYSKSTGALNDLATWGTNPNGSGTNPVDFTLANQTYNIVNNLAPTIAGTWAPVGIVNVGNGVAAVHFSIPAGFSYSGSSINMLANARLTINNTVTPDLGTLAATSTVAYSAGGAQIITGAAYGNLVIGGSGTKTTGGTIAVDGIFTLNSGQLALGSNDIILSNAVAGSLGVANHIIATGSGKVRLRCTANTLVTYPLGDGTNYTPITINISGSAYSMADVGVNITASKPGSNPNSNNYLNRYWSVVPTGIADPAAAVVAAYYAAPGDVAGSEYYMTGGAYTGAGPWINFAPVDAATHTFSTTATALTPGNATIFTGITASVDVSNFTATAATSVCSGASSTVSVNSTTLLTGRSYTASYTLGGAGGNSGTFTSGAFTYGVNTGSFIIDAANIALAGPTTIVVNHITDAVTSISSQTPLANNTATFSVFALPVASAGSNSPLCAGSNIDLAVTVVGGSSPLAFSWTGPGSFTGTDENISVGAATVDASGAYTVVVTDANHCADTAMTTVMLNDMPVISAGNNGPVCAGTTLSFNSGVTGGTSPYIYSWHGPNSFSDTAMNTSLSHATTAASGTYTVTVTDDGGCKDTVTTAAAVIAAPVITAINNTAPVCEGQSLSLTSVVTGGAGAFTYSWSGPNGFMSTEQDPTVTAAATTDNDGVYTLLVTDTVGCTATGINTTTATVYPLQPVVGSATVLFGQTTTLSNPIAGGTWSTPTPWTTSVTTNTGIVKGISAGIAEVSYTTAHGCISTHTVTMISGLSVCVGQSISISDGASGGTWTSSSGSLATVNNTTGVVTGVNAGKAILMHRLVTGTIITTTVTVHPLAATTAAPASVCQGLTLTLTNGTTGGGTWYSGNTTTAVVGNTGIVTGVTGGTVTMYFTPVAGCVAAKTVTIIPTPPITGITTVCVGQTIALTNSGAGGAWSSSSGAQATVSAAGIVKGKAAGTPRITYMWPTGCRSIAVVTVNPLLPITTVTGEVVCEERTIAYTNTTPGGGVWSSSNTEIAAVAASGTITGVSGGIAQVSFTTPVGCVATKSVTVRVSPFVSGAASVCAGQTNVMSSNMSGGAWSSSSGSTATVSAAGIVKGIAAGTARISYILTTGCYDVQSVAISALSPVTGGTSGMCQGGSMTLANATPFGGVWSSSNSAVATVGATGVVCGAAAGSTIISFASNVGACIASRTVTVHACRQGGATTSVDGTANELGEIQLFPNPNNGRFTVSGAINVFDGDVVLQVANMLGQTVFSGTVTVYDGRLEKQITLPENLANGTYILVLSGAGERKQYHFVVGQ